MLGRKAETRAKRQGIKQRDKRLDKGKADGRDKGKVMLYDKGTGRYDRSKHIHYTHDKGKDS